MVKKLKSHSLIRRDENSTLGFMCAEKKCIEESNSYTFGCILRNMCQTTGHNWGRRSGATKQKQTKKKVPMPGIEPGPPG